jgi:uncharacterized protein (DUF3820 family)
MAITMWKCPFKKHKGSDIEDIPDSYLQWLLEQDWLCEKYKNVIPIIEKELRFRITHDRHVAG